MPNKRKINYDNDDKGEFDSKMAASILTIEDRKLRDWCLALINSNPDIRLAALNTILA